MTTKGKVERIDWDVLLVTVTTESSETTSVSFPDTIIQQETGL